MNKTMRANGPKALWNNPESRKAVMQAIHDRSNDPEYKSEQAFWSRMIWYDPEYQRRQKEVNQRKHEASKKRLAKLRQETQERKEERHKQKEQIEQQYKEKTKLRGVIQRVRCITTGVEYESASMAERTLGLSSGSVTRCCRGYYKSTKGLTFEYV